MSYLLTYLLNSWLLLCADSAMPTISVSLSNRDVTIGGSTSFECQGHGRPMPQYLWYINAMPVEGKFSLKSLQCGSFTRNNFWRSHGVIHYHRYRSIVRRQSYRWTLFKIDRTNHRHQLCQYSVKKQKTHLFRQSYSDIMNPNLICRLNLNSGFEVAMLLL